MIHYVSKADIKDKRILLRVDFNVTLNPKHKISDDERIRRSLPTIKRLMRDNKLIIVTHLGRPKARNDKDSLRVILDRLEDYLPNVKIIFVKDFLSEEGKRQLDSQKNGEIILLENIRFYEGEENPSTSSGREFAKSLAGIADVFVNDAFGVSHRAAASVVGVTEFLPSYAGLLLEKEIEMIGGLLKNPKHPIVAVIGGAKVSTKFQLLNKLTAIADTLILGGGIANTFLAAKGFEVGHSLYEKGMEKELDKIISQAKHHSTQILLPEDVAVGDKNDEREGDYIRRVEDVKASDVILDIGPETQAAYGKAILAAKTIVWNGPVGYFENSQFSRGTDFLYYTITENTDAVSIIGGGDTIAAISKKEYLDRITHVSTGGGAMLEFIEKGTLPGIKALGI